MKIQYDPVPRTARRKWVIREACRFLIENEIRSLPIDIRDVIHQQGWILRSYGYLARAYEEGVSIDDISSLLGSPDAATFINDYGTPVICYNETIPWPERIDWSLLHEMGHLMLGHFLRFDMANLTDAERSVLDVEADTWAASVSAPVCVVDMLERPLKPGYRHIFGLSSKAWEVRLRTAARDRRELSPALADALMEQLAGFIYARRCEICGASFADEKRACTCPACGSRETAWVHDQATVKEKIVPIRRFIKRVSDNSPEREVRKSTPSQRDICAPFKDSLGRGFDPLDRLYDDRFLPWELQEYYCTENPMVIDALWDD